MFNCFAKSLIQQSHAALLSYLCGLIKNYDKLQQVQVQIRVEISSPFNLCMFSYYEIYRLPTPSYTHTRSLPRDNWSDHLELGLSRAKLPIARSGAGTRAHWGTQKTAYRATAQSEWGSNVRKLRSAGSKHLWAGNNRDWQSQEQDFWQRNYQN